MGLTWFGRMIAEEEHGRVTGVGQGVEGELVDPGHQLAAFGQTCPP
jgi:hypothetical protein